MLKSIIFLPVILLLSCTNSTRQEEPGSVETTTSIVHKKHFLKRPSYKMEYYDNWKIDSSDVDYDIDSYFTLDSPSQGGFVSVFIFNKTIDVKTHIEEQVKAHINQSIKNGKVTYFNNWEGYPGYGAVIEGKFSGVFKGVLKAFAYSGEKYSFIVLSQILNSDKTEDEPGLKLIESSFKLAE